MDLLEDLNYEGLRFSILGFEKEYETSDYPYLLMRIQNKRNNSFFINLSGSRYISQKYGILELYQCKPGYLHFDDEKMELISNSFVDFKLDFELLEKINGDRMELRLNGKLILLELDDENWCVLELPKEKKKNNKNFMIEHFESLEEKVGIVLQNFSVRVNKKGTELRPFCEVLPYGDGPYFDFAVEVVAYNKDNEIINFSRIQRNKEDFLGFEVFCFSTMYLDENVSNVDRIVFYPVKD